MADIMVNVDELRKLGLNVQEEANTYAGDVTKIYNVVDSLGASWKGPDNLAYVDKANSYKEGVINLGKAIESYGTALTTVANESERLMRDLAEAARGSGIKG